MKKGNIGTLFLQGLLLSGYLILLELWFHITEGMAISTRLVYPVLLVLPVGFIITAFFALFPKVINGILSIFFMLAAMIWTSVQVVYSSVFLSYMEINKISMGGDVADNFGTEMRDAIVANIPKIVLFVFFTAVFAVAVFFVIRAERKGLHNLLVFFL